MTRETKIGLLVGLAFIIVIGILLSDQRRAATDPVPAILSVAGPRALNSVAGPGSQSGPAVVVVQGNPDPRQPIRTQREMTLPRPPVVPITPRTDDQAHNPTPQPSIDRPLAREDHGADLPPGGLGQLMQRHPDELVSADPNHPTTPAPQPAPSVASVKTYKAQSGDSVSRMASRFLGGNNTRNRQAIIDANPSLQEDPDNVIIGKSYVIPQPASASTAVVQAPSPGPVTPAPIGTGQYYYTVEDGDTLWAIATDELGDASAVDAIKELNKNILRGENHDVVRVGMKLRLPGKPVASAD